jgi:hypothetical protein
MPVAGYVAMLFILASAVLMLYTPETITRMRNGEDSLHDWIPVGAATLVLVTVAVFAR